MTDEQEWPTRAQLANVIAQSANRLAWECENGMPENMIETERQLLLKKLIEFPVNAEAMEWVVRSKWLERQKELECLDEAGFLGGDNDD